MSHRTQTLSSPEAGLIHSGADQNSKRAMKSTLQGSVGLNSLKASQRHGGSNGQTLFMKEPLVVDHHLNKIK